MGRPKGSKNGDYSSYRNHPYYRYFLWMLSRAKRHNIPCNFRLDNEHDFYRFLRIMGVIPEGMIKPTVGRINHDLGYEIDFETGRWNMCWQSKVENSKEVMERNNRNDPGLASRAGSVGGFATMSEEKRREVVALAVQSPNHASKTGAWQRAGVASPNFMNKQRKTCIYCGYTSNPGIIGRDHNEKCKNKPK